ncbi:CoA transferase [Cryptosporangium arvum]|uniref:Putative acyl-CoA transferase/carnitine dehydratase n=1 Tax=Cryptosporangium arvum DSM 44712 TaxID=927661 RepID=A0A011A066_9ACTN|nr:CoA transferase [Cryptosporangium arvum]EXG82872.1 putative acyl-CoA transferase/carnitine dehydratase [Cryptosporangium arvum DSM 44712]
MTLPLTGLHVVDLCTYVAGPSACMTLAQLGADVVRIDPLGGATDTRRLPLAPGGQSLYWAGLNRGKRSIEVDLRGEGGRDVVRRLLGVPGEGHGILVTNAVGQSWLRHEELLAVRPDLIQIRIGGRADGRPAVDYTVNCEVGLPWVTGPVDASAPVNHVLPAGDLITGAHAALSVVSAERLRRATGAPQYVEINLADVAVATMAHLGFVADVVVNGSQRLREGNYLYGSYGCDFATVDARRVMVVALTNRHWNALIRLTGTADVLAAMEKALGVTFAEEEARYRYRDVISALLRPWFEQRTHAEVVASLETAKVLWGDYRTIEEMTRSSDGLLAASGLFTEVDDPALGRYPVPAPVGRPTGWTPPAPAPAPAVGADTGDVLTDWLGLPPAEIEALAADGAIRR